MAKYTVIIPHYNDFKRLGRALHSVPRRGDVEVIVVDDCTPDFEAYSDFKRLWVDVCFFRQKKNSGAGAARNAGLSIATGKYILFADSDDEFLPVVFDTLDACLQGDDITYFTAEAIQENTGLPSVRADAFNDLCFTYLNDKSKESLDNIRYRHCVPWAKAYSKEFLDRINIRFDETFVSNDVYFNVVSAARATSIKVIGDCLYRVYRLSDSLTSTESAGRLVERVRVSAGVARALKDLGVGERRSATGYILQSFKYGPLVFSKVLMISIKSDLDIDFFKVFKLSRWKKFVERAKVKRDETRSEGG